MVSASETRETTGETLAEQTETPALPPSAGQIDAGQVGAGQAAGESLPQEENSIDRLPDIKISGCFSSHMVLQRSCHVRIFGFSRHVGLKITGSWTRAAETGAAETDVAETTVGPDGRFTLVFPPREADREHTQMIISSAYGSYIFSDILVGDVWMIGGQSNAEHHLSQCIKFTPELIREISAEDNFRLFFQSQAKAFEFREDCAEPRTEILDPGWRWKKPDKETALSYSAMGYYFAKELTRHIDVPLGLIMICAGGACLRELMPYDLSVSRGYTFGANMPVGGYYNTLISPFIGLQFYGQLFFQGESEGIWKEMAYSYDADLAALVEDERETFGIDFPFYNVQLSSYRDEGKQHFQFLHVVRVKQFDAVPLIKNSYLTVDMDLGSLPEDNDFAHSPHKAELGRRLAMQVYAHEYGGDKVLTYPAEYESPIPVSVSRTEGGFIIKFKNTGSGLAIRQGTGEIVRGFGIIPEGEEEPHPAGAVITSGDTIFVKAAGETTDPVKTPAFVSYALFHKA